MATPEELIDDASARVDDYADTASSFINALQDFVNETNINVNVPGGKNWSISNAGGALFSEVQTGRPDIPDIELVTPESPGEVPDNFEVRDVEDIAIANFAETPPDIDIPDRPSLDIPSEPTAPALKDVSVPVSPTVTLPVSPTLTSVDIPDAPTIQLPVFTETFPVEPELLLSQTEFNYSDETYQNDVLDAIESVLLSDINDGGFGITPADEEQLYERTKDREVQASLKREKEILDSMTARGHLLPVGALLAQLESNKQDTMRAISDANREVNINRAELLRRGREFAIQQGLSLNDLLLRDFGFKQERALQAQRFAAEFAINVLDVQIRKYNAQIQAFAAFTQSYAERIRGLLASVEIYKAEVEGAIARQEANQQQINLYRTQIEAANQIVNLFEAQMRAATLETEIEKSKIETFQVQVQAFLGQIDARKSQVELYNSAIRGELAKSEIYRSQVDAYASQVDAAATRASVQVRNAESDIRKAELELTGYGAKIEKFKADLQAELGRLNSLVSSAQVDTDVFRSVLDGLSKVLDSDNLIKEIFIRTIQEDTKLDQEAARLQIQQLIEEAKIKLSAAQTGTSVFNNIVSAAQDTLNVLATVDGG